MKLTREMLHCFIDNSPPEDSAERVVIDMVSSLMIKCPQILPGLAESFGNILSEIIEKYLQTFYCCGERASYLETYLNGRMYSEEYNNKPEYIEIQKGHATTIKNKCENILYGEK